MQSPRGESSTSGLPSKMDTSIPDTPAQIHHSHSIRIPSLILHKIKTVARLICWRTLQPTMTLSSGVVVKVRSESDWEVANEIFLDRDYDDAIERAFLRRDSTDPIRVLDLGANVGLFSLRCIDRYVSAEPIPRLELIVVEGSPSVFADLEDRLSTHRGTRGISLTLRQALVGRRSGKAMIYSSLFHSCTNAVVRKGGKTSANVLLGRHAEDSEYLDLDKLIPSSGAVDLIKCDIEGSELEFLQNYESLLRRTRLLVIEFHPGHCDASACQELLGAYGFCKLRTIKSRPTHSLEMFSRCF